MVLSTRSRPADPVTGSVCAVSFGIAEKEAGRPSPGLRRSVLKEGRASGPYRCRSICEGRASEPCLRSIRLRGEGFRALPVSIRLWCRASRPAYAVPTRRYWHPMPSSIRAVSYGFGISLSLAVDLPRAVFAIRCISWDRGRPARFLASLGAVHQTSFRRPRALMKIAAALGRPGQQVVRALLRKIPIAVAIEAFWSVRAVKPHTPTN